MKRTASGRPLLPVILAGGDGKRLAPLSTPECPKPFIPLPDGRSLLTATLQRLIDKDLFLPPILVGQAAHRYALLNHARAAGVVPAAILLEPAARNTAMAIACAGQYARQCFPDAMLAILPADQAIHPMEPWQNAMRAASETADQADTLCLLGVPPHRPEPQFGYLEPGHAVGEGFTIRQFIEKPENPLLLSPSCLWNAGHFVVDGKRLLRTMERHLPAVTEAARQAVAEARAEWEFTRLAEPPYARVEAASFDRVIVEKMQTVGVRLEAAWQDLGSVEAWENYTGETLAEACRRPARTDRPWGYFELLAAEPHRLEKRLTLYPGCRLSLQRHHARKEDWEIVAGEALIELDGHTQRLSLGQQRHIPAKSWHRLENPGPEILIVHEIQWGTPDETILNGKKTITGE